MFSSIKISKQNYTLQLPQLPFCNIPKVVTVIRVPLCCEKHFVRQVAGHVYMKSCRLIGILHTFSCYVRIILQAPLSRLDIIIASHVV